LRSRAWTASVLALGLAVGLGQTRRLFAQEPELVPPILTAAEHYVRAERYLLEERYEEADVELQVAIHKDDLRPAYHHVLGRLRLHQKRYPEAIEEFCRAIALDPFEIEVQRDLALAHSAVGDRESAVNALREAARVHPNDARLRYQLGSLLDGMAREDEALQEYVQAIMLLPVYAEAYRALGRLYQRRGNLDKAILFYDQAGRMNPLDLEVHFLLGGLYLTYRGDFAKARTALEYVHQADPEDFETAKLLVRVYYGLKEDDLGEGMRRCAGTLATASGKASEGDRLLIDDFRPGTRRVRAEALLAPREGEPVAFEIVAVAADGSGSPPDRRFAVVRGSRWSLVERTSRGDLPIEEFGEPPPPYRPVIDAVLEVLKQEKPADAGAASSPADPDGESGRRGGRRR